MLTGRTVLHLTEKTRTVDSAMAIFKQQANLLDNLVAPTTIRPNIPQGLDDVVFGLLAFRPAQRCFCNALEFISALDCVLAAKGMALRTSRH